MSEGKRHSSFAAIGLAAVLAACSGSADQHSGLTACAVLEDIDLAAVMGQAPQKIAENNLLVAPDDAQSTLSGCDVLDSDGNAVLSLMLREAKDGTEGSDADAAIDSMIAAFEPGTADKISIGEGGYYSEVSATSSQLGLFTRNGRMLMIFNGMAEATDRAMLEAAANAALEKVQN